MPESWRPERRRTERHPVTFPLHARVEVGSGAMWPVRGLSITGLVLESPEALDTGRTLVFTLDPDNRADAIGPLSGRVVHSRLVLPATASAPPSYVAGVAFEPLPPGTTSQIAQLLASVEDPASRRHT